MDAASRSARSIPSQAQMYWPTLRALIDLGGSGRIQEIDERVGKIANYSETQQKVLHKNGPQTELAYRLAWARTKLKEVGAVENSARGIWTITDRGRSIRQEDIEHLRSNDRPNPIGTASDEHETSRDGWRTVLLDVIQTMPPDRFERLCQRVLRESGFVKVEVTGRSGDGGIDGVGVLRVSLLSFHVLFQCKRYTGKVVPSAIRDFRGAMAGRVDKGLFITTGSFTADATKEATRDRASTIDLIDGDDLCDLLKSLKLGVNTRLVEEVSIDDKWFGEL